MHGRQTHPIIIFEYFLYNVFQTYPDSFESINVKLRREKKITSCEEEFEICPFSPLQEIVGIYLAKSTVHGFSVCVCFI